MGMCAQRRKDCKMVGIYVLCSFSFIDIYIFIDIYFMKRMIILVRTILFDIHTLSLCFPDVKLGNIYTFFLMREEQTDERAPWWCGIVFYVIITHSLVVQLLK
jgi:hypothetical protein